MSVEPPALNVYITTESASDPKTSTFSPIKQSARQPLGATTSLSYIYSTLPAFTLVDNADLTNSLNIASSGPPYHFPAAGSTVITYMDFGPNPNQEEGFWHRTQTVDYIVMLEGELELSLDGGEKRLVKTGEVIVQRAAMHRWKNPSQTESARYVAVLMGAEGAVEDGVEYGGQHLTQ